MADVLTVKCAYCKEVIELDLDKVQEIVKYDNSYYHKECFRKMCKAKLLSKILNMINGYLHYLRLTNIIRKHDCYLNQDY